MLQQSLYVTALHVMLLLVPRKGEEEGGGGGGGGPKHDFKTKRKVVCFLFCFW